MMTSSKILFYFCLSFIAGIFLNSIMKIPEILFSGIFVLSILMIIFGGFMRSNNGRASIIGAHKNQALVLGFCILFLSLGIFRFQISQFIISNDKLIVLNDKLEKITLTGHISSEPDIRSDLQKLKVKINNSKSIVLVTTVNYPEFHYLDTVKITGTLKTPPTFNNFNYKNYLQKDGIYSVMDYPKIDLISAKHAYSIFSFLYEKILFLKSKLLNGISASLSPPHSFILEGMVFGNDKNISKQLKNQFNVTGLSHVTAVSGANIVIIINILVIFLLMLGFWRGQAFYGAVIFIWIYIILIGFPASGVRAAIMGCVALLAQKLGRQNSSSRVLVATATLMLVQNPLLLIYDIAFQLSFLASLGIIHIKPLIDIFFKIISNKYTKTLVDILSITLSAQIITLPIIVFNFGMISLIAPVTNLLALPVVGALTVLGFLLSIFGAILPISGFIFAVPCWFLLSYFMKVLDIFSQPWAVAQISYFPWFLVVVYYAILFTLIAYLKGFTRLNDFYQG